MTRQGFFRRVVATTLVSTALVCTTSHATEGASGMYLLGGRSLNAGISPGPGLYFTIAPAHYGGSVGGSLEGGVKVLELHKHVDSSTLSMLYAPKRKFLGAQVALVVGVPYAYARLRGEAQNGDQFIQRAVSGSGVGDLTFGARLGWKIKPGLDHAVSLSVWAPTGEYQKGFNPSFSRNRWASDATYSITWSPVGTPIEFSGAMGYGVSTPNTATRYRSGNDSHLELATGYRLPPHWEVGVGSYMYRQLTADTGAGARLGPLEGRVSGIGPAINYLTKIDGHAFVITARYYRDFNAKRYFSGSLALATFTLRM